MGQMEVDHGRSPRDPLPKSHSVQVEIEQRWHQVETTPLREEKQVPIASPSDPGITPPPSGDRLPPHERVVLLDREVRSHIMSVSSEVCCTECKGLAQMYFNTDEDCILK